MIANLSPAERQSPAIVRDITASPAGLFATEAEGGRHLVTIDKSFFNLKLPRETIQFITVHWNWNETDKPKVEANYSRRAGVCEVKSRLKNRSR